MPQYNLTGFFLGAVLVGVILGVLGTAFAVLLMTLALYV